MIVTDGYDMADWLSKQLKTVSFDDSTKYIGLVRDEKLVAVCGYSNYEKKSISQHIAAIGNLNYEFLHFIFYYPFIQLGVKKIIGPIKSNNHKCLKFAKKLGFKHEATISEVYEDADLFILTMEKKDCKMLLLGDPSNNLT
jgi:RimJ/RimL family protein N-acetyltransferase